MYVGIDVHKRFCVAALVSGEGELVGEMRFPNSAEGLNVLVEKLEVGSRLVVEASTSSLPVYDYLTGKGFEVVVAHPLKVKAIASAKIKTDKIDSRILAHLLRADLIPESYVPDKTVRDLRTLVSHRMSLVCSRTALKNRVHAVLSKEGVSVGVSDLFGKNGRLMLSAAVVSAGSRLAIDQDLLLIDELNKRVFEVDKELVNRSKGVEEMRLLNTVPGIGPVLAVILLSEIGDIRRFSEAGKLCSYAGLVPSTHQSGKTNRHGGLIQGRNLMKWALIQAARKAIRVPGKAHNTYLKLEKKGKHVAVAAVARELTVAIYWMLTRGTEYQAYGKGGLKDLA
jgi:transposase